MVREAGPEQGGRGGGRQGDDGREGQGPVVPVVEQQGGGVAAGGPKIRPIEYPAVSRATAAVAMGLPVASATVPVIERIVRAGPAGPGQIPVATITISTSTRRAM
ncbi:hypothetical protein ACFV4E_40865 [Streptomyces hygroscopicus]|uniref:hypothetical protein n=1 Tax=Streptomyces hygroscopicus TaxID=1912 RepID=UPI00131E7277|nr:hypothetical protein [Streptomyces hygroscopicus]